jgi:hypothetical protein
MSTPNTFSNADLKAAEALLKLVDALVIKNTEGRVIGRCVWKINLVFHDWQLLDRFVSIVPKTYLVWWGKGKPMKFESVAAQKQMTKIRTIEIENAAENMLPKIGVSSVNPVENYLRNAQSWFLEMYARKYTPFVPAFPNEGAGISVLQLGLPLEWSLTQPDDKRAVWFTQKAVELMQPFWCTAGWGVALPPDGVISPTGGDEVIGEQQVLFPYLKRFPGMEALDVTSLGRPHFNKAMYSVNWLNFVSDPLLDKLGGREAIKAAALNEPQLITQDVGNCLMISAGPGPGLGDTERGMSLPGYGVAARLLRPIRVGEIKNPCVAPPPYGSGDEKQWMLASDAYLSRFDQY